MLAFDLSIRNESGSASRKQLTREIREQHYATHTVKRWLLAAVLFQAITCVGAGQTTAAACGKLNVSSISASTNDGNVPSNAIDGSLATRWSGLGVGAYITADLGSPHTVCSLSVAWYQGNLRTNFFVISASSDGVTYHNVYSGNSTGTTTNLESYSFTPTTARTVRVTVNGNSVNNWASITELQVIGMMSTYDQTIVNDRPVAFWDMSGPGNTEPDLSGNRNTGTYQGGVPATSTMPNGDRVVVFNGSNQYLSVPSNASLSIPTTGNFTWEAWIRPTVLQFPNNLNGYIDFMGKCASYSPTCEWEARFYDSVNSQSRCNRLSAYVFNPTAGLGSGADWQPACGLFQPGQWFHVVGEYTTLTQPLACPNSSNYPGSIDIWVNGIKWNQSAHNPTGCMSQYSVKPKANTSPLEHRHHGTRQLVPGSSRQGGDLQLPAKPGTDQQPLSDHDGKTADRQLRGYMHLLN